MSGEEVGEPSASIEAADHSGWLCINNDEEKF
jgi:hypothetical protein